MKELIDDLESELDCGIKEIERNYLMVSPPAKNSSSKKSKHLVIEVEESVALPKLKRIYYEKPCVPKWFNSGDIQFQR